MTLDFLSRSEMILTKSLLNALISSEKNLAILFELIDLLLTQRRKRLNHIIDLTLFPSLEKIISFLDILLRVNLLLSPLKEIVLNVNC